MNFRKNSLIHWIAAAAIAMSALAPAVSQAVSLAKHGQGFAMEICSVDGSKMQIDVHPDVSKMVWKFGRCHHHVDYTPFKKQKLIKKEGLEISPAVKDYGMKLIRIK